MDSELVRALKQFNRKERFWLLSDAIGEPFTSLNPAFLSKVGDEIGIALPSNPWWAFDYHFDWLHAVLTLGPAYNLTPLPGPALNNPPIATGGQEDIDLLIAFDQTIVLIEAKLSTSWTNKQMESKFRRMTSLPTQYVQPHFVLASPTKPKRLNLTCVPSWALKAQDETAQLAHIILPGREDQDSALMVSRCDVDGTKSALGGHWKIFEA